jgi:DNA-binding response OmpR family regulator
MSKKILIVDDNEFMVELMTYILSNKGYSVAALFNGDHVFQHIKATHPDLVILDMMLPGADGRDICKEIKLNKDTKDLRVIMCSGNSDEMTESLNQQGAPDDILHKPFDMTSLINKVDMQLAA